MARPKKTRSIFQPPLYCKFKPEGGQKAELGQICLSLDEYEALRLVDYLHLEQTEAAVKMGISRPTLTRLLGKARNLLVSFIVEGKPLCIEGGVIHFRYNLVRCLDCKRLFQTNFVFSKKECPHCGSTNLFDMAGGFGHGACCGEDFSLREVKRMPNKDGRGPSETGTGNGRGSGGGAYGPGGDCICVGCGERLSHQPGVSCTSLKCPKCGRTMIREELYNDRK